MGDGRQWGTRLALSRLIAIGRKNRARNPPGGGGFLKMVRAAAKRPWRTAWGLVHKGVRCPETISRETAWKVTLRRFAA